MRDRHRRRADGSLTVHFRQMPVHHVRVFCDQELPTNREACVLFGFRNTGFLQQFQRCTARTDKDEFGFDVMFRFAVFQIGDGHRPGIIVVTFKSTDFGAQLQCKVRLFLQRSNQLARNFAVVHVRSHFGTRSGDFLFRIAPFHHQRCAWSSE